MKQTILKYAYEGAMCMLIGSCATGIITAVRELLDDEPELATFVRVK